MLFFKMSFRVLYWNLSLVLSHVSITSCVFPLLWLPDLFHLSPVYLDLLPANRICFLQVQDLSCFFVWLSLVFNWFVFIYPCLLPVCLKKTCFVDLLLPASCFLHVDPTDSITTISSQNRPIWCNRSFQNLISKRHCLVVSHISGSMLPD